MGVYCGSSPGLLPEYRAAAAEFGGLLARAGITLVYGGGKIGLMGSVADGALRAGGRVIGVMPRSLIAKEIAHHEITQLHAVDTMQERKRMMAELADGFVALPGGMGTLDEIFEVITLSQLGIQAKPCGFLNTAGYYDQLLGFLEHMMGQRFLKTGHFQSLVIATQPALLLARMQSHEHCQMDKWFDLPSR